MQAFHNSEEIKKRYLSRVAAHRKADELVRGIGWENGKGCAVGCTLEDYDHSKYESELGIPEWLARVEDCLFEGMSESKSHTWPEKFLSAIPVGADLGPIKSKFICILLQHSIQSMKAAKYDAEKFPYVKAAIDGSISAVEVMIRAQTDGGIEAARSAWSAAEPAAASAARSAWSAARSVARSARSAAQSARSAARSAAQSAAWAAWSAAQSAAWAARSAAQSAQSAAAESAAYDYYADELLKLLKKCG